jgi:hypothetical protein
MRKPLWALIVVVMLLASGSLFAQSFFFEDPSFPSARVAGMGGTHVALADDISTLISNPAGFRSAGPQFAVTELTANLTGPVFSIADLVLSLMGGANPLSLLVDPGTQALFTSLYAQALLSGPISFGYVGNGLGFGFFNTTGITFSTQGTVPTLTAGVHEDLLFVGGYAFRIPLPDVMRSTLDLGVSVKAYARGGVEFTESILDIFALLSSPSFTSLLDKPLNIDVGFGVDAGILYSWNSMISVGIVGRDLYAPVVRNTYASITAFGSGSSATLSYGTAPINLSAGILLSPNLGPVEDYLSNLKIAIDYGDILDFLTHPATSTNPLLHVGIGLEARVLEILSLRGGFNEGYFSAGLGLNLTGFQLGLTMYGSELSSEPGLRPAYNLLVSVEFKY